MKAIELSNALSEGLLESVDDFTFEGIKEIEDCLCVDGLVSIPIANVSSSIDQEVDIEVLAPDNSSLGTLCFARRDDLSDVNTFSRWRYAAYLADCELADLVSTSYQLKAAYLVVDEAKYNLYKTDFMNSAPLWGKFTHYRNNAPHANSEQDVIRAVEGLHLPTPHHYESLSRYCRANNPLDRFLRLYHCIELLFDYIVVAKIRRLQPDLQGFPRILSEFGSTELDRLKGIMKECCLNAEKVAAAIIGISEFKTQRHDIFRLFAKSGDPLKDDVRWEKFLAAIDSGDVTAGNLHGKKVISKPEHYDSLILEVAAYWIYRVRSSIAHSRVGEYLLNDVNSAFVSEFAEPLLMEVVIQILSSAPLKALAPSA